MMILATVQSKTHMSDELLRGLKPKWKTQISSPSQDKTITPSQPSENRKKNGKKGPKKAAHAAMPEQQYISHMSEELHSGCDLQPPRPQFREP
jgi:hypothetical protein